MGSGDIDHLVLEVADLERSEQFYRDVLGLRALGRDLWPEATPHACLQTDEGDYVVLVEMPNPKPDWSQECAYFSMTPDHWHALDQRLKEHGHRAIGDVKGGIRGAGELRVRVRDPDGHALELHAFEPEFYEHPAANRGKIVAGRSEEFPVGSVTRFAEGKFYLLRLAEGFLAISEVCTHRQFTVTYQPERHRFWCPLHGNRYSRTGKLIHRGAREETPPLHVYSVEFVDGWVMVDTDRSIPRNAEEAERLVPVPIPSHAR